MAIIYVSKSGSDANDGLSVANAKLTIAAATGITEAGENTIHIGVGEYIEAWSTFSYTSGEEVILKGDYDGTVFSSSAGEIKISSSSDVFYRYIKQIDRITIKLTSSFKCFGQSMGYGQDITFNYVLYETPQSNCSLVNDTADVYNCTITYNNCDFHSACVSPCKLMDGSSIAYGGIKLIFNDCDFHTYSKFQYFYKGPTHETWNNCNIAVDSYIFDINGGGKRIFNNCLFEDKDTNPPYLLYYADTASKQPWAGNNCYFHDCTIKGNGTNVDFSQLVWNNTSTYAPKGSIQDTNTCIGAKYEVFARTHFVFDNCNANGQVILVSSNGVIFYDVDQTQAGKQLLYVKSNGGSSDYIPNIFKLKGLAANTSYNVTFKYNRLTSTATVRAGILEFDQSDKKDLYTTPANAYTYADFTSGAHTASTWYDKTLTFTTDVAGEGKEYYLVIYQNTAECNFKMTKPEVAAS